MPNPENLQFFRALVSAPSPSGYEQPAQVVLKDYLMLYSDDVRTDRNGNIIALKRGTGDLKVMVVGHADEIGMIVNHIDEQGFLYVKPLGGFDVNLLPGLRLDIYHQGQIVRGIIGKKPVHMLRGSEEGIKLKLEDLWIDIGAKDREHALQMVSIGDVVTYSSVFEHLTDDLIVSKATDNKVGVYVAAAVMRALQGKNLKSSYFAVSSVGEETTMRGARTGAWQVEPDIAIAVDVTFSSDIPGVDKRVYGDVKLGGGPTITLGAAMHPSVNQRLRDVAEKIDIKYQLEIAPGRTGTDADVIHDLKAGASTAVISIPNRYMHTPNEVISLADLDAAVELITGFLESLDEGIDLTR